MLKKSTCLALFLLSASLCFAQFNLGTMDTTRAARENPQSRKAITVASEFMKKLIEGAPSDSLVNLCGIPFCHDDSVVIGTRVELKKALEEVLSANAPGAKKNHPRVDTAYVFGVEKGILYNIVPLNIYLTIVNIRFTINGQQPVKQTLFAIQMGDEPKIVGMSN
ncbi:hypothetical protein ACX0G9_04765 [Flavitalea flava]